MNLTQKRISIHCGHVSRLLQMHFFLFIYTLICLRLVWNEKRKKYHSVGTITKSNIKIVGRGKIITLNTQRHDRSLSWLGTCTSITNNWVKVVLWTRTFDLYYPINLVTTFSWPPTRDTRNYQLLVICHARSNVTSLSLSLKKKGQNTTTKSQSCVKIVKWPTKKLIVFFSARQGLSGPYQIHSPITIRENYFRIIIDIRDSYTN